ncbi:hypothetical protein L227DRAFT_642985 [Lentinus tigrinus ALCF2SS1-6]|uniref:Uncharacterized protein n=1 Tax=Lentinus tigrinus ALCF2SS1-6 TaxID=1328759 RepID=A0A5C2SK04_9APHY|nr:hypothetical protein L227DRAFT_642985 [Lentinus tigrinus ALCF2SS1-6]
MEFEVHWPRESTSRSDSATAATGTSTATTHHTGMDDSEALFPAEICDLIIDCCYTDPKDSILYVLTDDTNYDNNDCSALTLLPSFLSAIQSRENFVRLSLDLGLSSYSPGRASVNEPDRLFSPETKAALEGLPKPPRADTGIVIRLVGVRTPPDRLPATLSAQFRDRMRGIIEHTVVVYGGS